MHNQILRGLIFIILVFLVTSDLKELFSTLATSSHLGTLVQRPAHGRERSSHNQRSKRHVPSSPSQNSFSDGSSPSDEHEEEDDGSPIASMKLKQFSSRDVEDPEDSSSEDNEQDSLDPVKRLTNRGQNLYAKKKIMKLNDEERKELSAMKTQLTAVMQEWCLPKLVCELHASVSDRGSLTEAEKGLLSLIRETSLGTMGEVVSRYHFAAHMGQLLSGVEGNGCHNFYPNCPLSGSRVLQMMKKVRIR